MRVQELTADEFVRFYGCRLEQEFWGYAARDGAKTIALGGLLKGDDGRWWAFLDQMPTRRGGYLYKYARSAMRRAAEDGLSEVFVLRDHRFSSSEGLLRRLGFEPTGETLNDFEVWKWLIPSP